SFVCATLSGREEDAEGDQWNRRSHRLFARAMSCVVSLHRRSSRNAASWPRVANLSSPDVGKSGKPDRNSIANVEAFLRWAGVVVVFDEFERRTLVQGIPDMREWDDAAVRTVRMAANEFGLKMTAEFTNEAVLSI